MGKHEAASGKAPRPAGDKSKPQKKKSHPGRWIALAIVVVLGCYGAWFFLSKPDQRSVVGDPTLSAKADPEQPASANPPEEPGKPAEPGPENNDPATPATREMKPGWYTILLAGTTDDYNTDTMMLCAVDAENGKVKLVSINRDTQIDVEAKNKKINAAYGRKGEEAMCQAVTDITGVPINYYVLINMDAFKKVVDMVGGVEYDVPMDMVHPDLDKQFDINLSAGLQTLDGSKALQFVRYRSTAENDFGRVNRQKDFLIAAMKQVMAKFSVSQIQEYIEVFNENVKTNMSVKDMVWFYLNVAAKLNFGEDVASDTLPYASTGYYNKAAYVYLDPQEVVDFVNANLNPYTTPITLSDVNIPHLEDE